MGRLEHAGVVVREWLSLPLVAVCLTGWRMCGYSSSFVDGAAGLMRHEARTVLEAVVCVLPWPFPERSLSRQRVAENRARTPVRPMTTRTPVQASAISAGFSIRATVRRRPRR